MSTILDRASANNFFGGGIQNNNKKADKYIPSRVGNFASLDKNGNLMDSGKHPSDMQEKLISGQTLKTINNVSLLGSGNIEIPVFSSNISFDIVSVDY